MGKRRRILLAAVLAAVLGGLVWVFLRPHGPPEPVYEGHTVGYWLRHPKALPGSGSAWVDHFRPYDYSGIDPKAVPYLIEALKTRDGPLQRAYIKVWPGMPRLVRKHLSEPVEASFIRWNAAYTLLSLKNAAKPAVPALIHTLREDEASIVRFAAAIALPFIGEDDPSVREALIEAQKDPDVDVRNCARAALRRISSQAATKAGVK